MAEPGDPHQPDPDPVVETDPEPQAAPPVTGDVVPEPEPEPEALAVEAEEPEPAPEPGPEAVAGVPESEPEPEPEPEAAHPAFQDADAHVGFASAASLIGQARAPEPEPVSPVRSRAKAEPVVVAPAVDAGATFALAQPVVRRRREPAAVAGGMSLFTVYALILFAVPTFGASIAIALLAVTGRPLPDDAVARSHFLYQQRTLWGAAVAAVIGAILIVVNIGVFVLFALAVWLLVRGAAGVWRLKAGEAIADPRGWLI